MDEDPILFEDYRFGTIEVDGSLPPTVQIRYASIPVATAPYQYQDKGYHRRDPRTISPPSAPIQYNTIGKAASPYKYHNPANPNQHPKDVSMPCAKVYVAPVLYQPIRYPNDSYRET